MRKNEFIEDLLSLHKFVSTVFFWAKTDLRARYRTTYLGPFWQMFGLGVGSIGLGFFWSYLWNQPAATMVPSVTIGFLAWNLISAIINDSCNLVRSRVAIVKFTRAPLSFISCHMIATHITNFLHGGIFIIIVLMIFPNNLNPISLLFFINLLIVVVMLFSLSFLLMIYGAKYTDFAALINNIMPLMFFITPVVFRLDQAAGLRSIMIYNPISHMITLIRDPLEGTMPPIISYTVCFTILVVCFVTCYVKGRNYNFRKEIAWLL